ncbi:methyltransferase domain-containing protein [Sulfitobacter sp. JBTF-M27]|uniref:Methyltransferase domain-containing protein n=1 Tax=Sulfitobacter sediminilitoris TaxID=2698830 RepID=A0A6P0CDY3_9RHOB|nr:methyltransferase domain-containing protein [Sulfitobacter sediminilitoris]NEK23560.1 methyltransferase domain-containing protein [Sulfitobacter sediminilitoris]
MSGTNADQQTFWSDQAGPLWVAQMDAMDTALAPVLDLLLDRADISEGARILDIGCGAGTSTFKAARRAGPLGGALGVDISDTLVAAARSRAEGIANVSFALSDAQSHGFVPNGHDGLISRFGVMFFDDPVAAFANMSKALTPGAQMTFASWGSIPDNPYFTLPARIAKQVIGAVPKSDPDAPGPFAFREVGRVTSILKDAGLTDVEADEVHIDLTPEGDSKAVADLMCEIGPAHRALDYFEASDDDRARLVDALASALQDFQTPQGIRLPALVNIFTARKAA